MGTKPSERKMEQKNVREQAQGAGKAPEIIEKMVEGRLRKYYEEMSLEDQIYVVDGESKIKKVVDQAVLMLKNPPDTDHPMNMWQIQNLTQHQEKCEHQVEEQDQEPSVGRTAVPVVDAGISSHIL